VRFARTSGDRLAWLRLAVFCKLIFICVAGGLAMFQAPFIAGALLAKPELTGAIRMGVAAGCSLCMLRTVAAELQERERFLAFSLTNFMSHFVNFAALLVAAFALDALDLRTTLWIYTATALTLGAWSLVRLARTAGNFLAVERSKFAEFASFGKWMLCITVVFFIFQKVDLMFVTRFLSLEEVGVYNVAIQLVMIVSLVTAALTRVFLPKAMSAMGSAHDYAAFLKEAYLAVALVLTVLAGLALGAGMLVDLVYGERYAEAAWLLRILLIGWGLHALYLPLSFVFYAIKRPRTRFLLECATLSAAVVLLLLLAPRFGLTGAAIGMSGAFGFGAVLSGFTAIRMQRDLFARTLAVLRNRPLPTGTEPATSEAG
jgi:O-antigen/teichoic acid export membrane protein